MLCRVTERRGLYDTDGGALPDDAVRAAWYGSAIDNDICHLSVRDMLSNMCNRSIVSMVREFDLEGGTWFTDPYDECGRYADDILLDWRAHGRCSYESLHDTASMYVGKIISCAKPDRRFGAADFSYVPRYGTIPNAIPEPGRPAPYTIGEGHAVAPDGVGHPLLEHVARCTPPGLLPHSMSGCAHRVGRPAPRAPPAAPNRAAAQPEKDKSIRNMVASLHPDAAHMLEQNGRHDMVLCGGVDASEALGLADAIRARHGTPVGCIILQSDALLCDTLGNDAKRIVSRGVPLAGDMRVRGPVMPPRPAGVTAGQMIWNLDRMGFPVCARDAPGQEPALRPEYVVAASQFHMEPRWFLSGTAMLLRRPDIEWGLMSYLARAYGFAGLVRGILEALEGIDGEGAYREALRTLGAVRPVLDAADVGEALRMCRSGGRRRAGFGNAAVAATLGAPAR